MHTWELLYDSICLWLRAVNSGRHRADKSVPRVQIFETVFPMYKTFVEPDLDTAHLRIVNTFNPFSGACRCHGLRPSSHSGPQML